MKTGESGDMELMFAGGPGCFQDSPFFQAIQSLPFVSCGDGLALGRPFGSFFKYFEMALPVLSEYQLGEHDRSVLAQQLFLKLLSPIVQSPDVRLVIDRSIDNSDNFEELKKLGFLTLYILCSPAEYIDSNPDEDEVEKLEEYCQNLQKLRAFDQIIDISAINDSNALNLAGHRIEIQIAPSQAQPDKSIASHPAYLKANDLYTQLRAYIPSSPQS